MNFVNYISCVVFVFVIYVVVMISVYVICVLIYLVERLKRNFKKKVFLICYWERDENKIFKKILNR